MVRTIITLVLCVLFATKGATHPGSGIVIDKEGNIYFTDTGKGIAKANIPNVFKPGFTTKKRGWGLGLSLSRRIIESYHKGELFVKQSEPGKGSIFRIVLPKS